MKKSVAIRSSCIAVTVVLGGLYIAFFAKTPPHRRSPDVSRIEVCLEVKRLEQVLFSLDGKDAIRTFLKENQLFATQFLGLGFYINEETLIERLHAMTQDADMRSLYKEVQKVFGTFPSIQQQFESAFRYLRHYYPTFKLPQVATFITGMHTDLYVSDDLIVIGLDFFMGEKAQFRPIGLPSYILETYQPAHILPKVTLLLAQKFIKDDEADQTLLADMIYYGKACYFAQAILPRAKESIILAYTPEQLANAKKYQSIIWEHFIENELLYTANHVIKNKYIGDRPSVPEISPGCPGNVGKWLGWEVVRMYMKKHPETSLPKLMESSNAPELLVRSGYRPRQ